MKKLFLILISLSAILYSQSDLQIKVEDAIPTSSQIDWGIDKAIINNEPAGGFSGIQKANGTLYVAVNDTLSTANLGLVIFTSTDAGDTWSLFGSGITYRGHYEKIKMIRSGLDSIYCTFQIGTGIYTWNPLSGNFGQFFVGNYRTYDMVASSTGNLYIFADSLPNSSIVRYGSTTGGKTWISRGLVTSGGAMPKLFMSGTGDTLTLNYYGPVLPDTATSVVRQARYRETGPGTMASAGFIDVVTGTDYKKEFKTVINNGESWVFYTLGLDGSRDIWARKSSDNGATYGSPMMVAGNPNTDEYAFDATFYAGFSSSGFDLVYYSDSAQVGQGTNATDKMLFKSVPYASTTFSSPQQISENPPAYSPLYSTSILAMPYSGADVAALWVGDESGTKKLFWDKLSAIIPVELTSFLALGTKDGVQLNWETATEINNQRFEIERSNDSQNFTIVGSVNGRGTTTEKSTYSFVDKGVNEGKYYYRLKQVDYNGAYEYSQVIEVEFSVPQVFSLAQNYPNPFNPTTTLSFGLPVESNITLSVYNSLGELVKVVAQRTLQAGTHNMNFNAVDLPSGIYLYTLNAKGTDGVEFTQTAKMLLLK